MWPWIKKFFTDETAFVGYSRALVLGLGALTLSGQLPPEIQAVVPKWAGAALVALGGFIRAGEKNTQP